MAEILNFHVKEDFAFAIGKEGKQVVIPRMKFTTGGTVIQKIAEIQGKDIKSAINLLVKVRGNEVAISEGIESVVATLIREKNYDVVYQLLAIISENTLTKEIVEAAACQFDEVVKILVYLIEGNFSSLKNLSASLKAITSSAQ